MGCHGNHAFLQSKNKFQDKCFFRIQGVPINNLATMKTCPGVGEFM